MKKHFVLPFVSALLVTRNEREYIKISLMSLINQTYPSNRYEIIVVDGMSDDGTLEYIEHTLHSLMNKQLNIRILPNPKRILAAGWNIGIQNAKGKYVVRIDAHAEANPDFIEKSVLAMMRVNATCVGGKLVTKNLGGNGIIAKVLSSKFGVGNSSFRVSSEEGYTDTAVYGLYIKDIFDQVGLFDENFVRNQDIELHNRIRNAGGSFYFCPQICCKYYARHSIRKMMQQAFNNGKWNMVLLKSDYHALSVRHLVPFIFVLFLISSALGGMVWHPLWFLMLCTLSLHFLIGFCVTIPKAANVQELFLMPLLFFLLHITYGIGYFAGLTVRIERRK